MREPRWPPTVPGIVLSYGTRSGPMRVYDVSLMLLIMARVRFRWAAPAQIVFFTVVIPTHRPTAAVAIAATRPQATVASQRVPVKSARSASTM